MTARIRRMELTNAQRRAAARGNAALALVPRLKADGWRLVATQWLSSRFGATAARVTAAQLKRRGVRVETVRIPSEDGGVSVRILNPPGPARGVVLDIHGGGWVVGSAGLNDRLNADLVAETGLAVVSVDYRLLSEPNGVLMQHALSDCMAAGRWLAETARTRFGTDRLFLSGQSAGAHLAALTALALRDEGRLGAFRGCVLTYGVYDLSGTPSARAAGPETLILNGPTLASDLGRLTPDRDEAGRRLPDISPLYADLHGLPPALFISGDLDPLRDDSRLMADAWSGDAELLEAPLAPHGFIHFGGPLANRALDEIQAWLERRLALLEDAGTPTPARKPVVPAKIRSKASSLCRSHNSFTKNRKLPEPHSAVPALQTLSTARSTDGHSGPLATSADRSELDQAEGHGGAENRGDPGLKADRPGSLIERTGGFRP